MGILSRLFGVDDDDSGPRRSEQSSREDRPEAIDRALQSWDAGDLQTAEKFFESALRGARRGSDDFHFEFVLGRYSAFLVDTKQPDRALPLLEEAVGMGTTIPATWRTYLDLVFQQGDLSTLLDLMERRREVLRSPQVTPAEEALADIQSLIRYAGRAERGGDIDFGLGIARHAVELSEDWCSTDGRWLATGKLGHLLEKAGQTDGAIELWWSAFNAGSTDHVTINRLSMHLDRRKKFEEAIQVAKAGLERGLPANWEEKLRKRIDRCEAKLTGRKRKEIAAFSVRKRSDRLQHCYQLRVSPPIRSLRIVDNYARCLCNRKGASYLVDVDVETGVETRRVERLPQLSEVFFAPSGHGLGVSLHRSTGARTTQITFLEPTGEVERDQALTETSSEVACHKDRWYVGCRDGYLYAFDLLGQPVWKWRTPKNPSSDAWANVDPFPYYVTTAGRFAVVSSMGAIYAIDERGKCAWNTMVPDSPQGELRFSLPLELIPGVADAYGLLGLSTEATIEEVKRAYQEKALATHPDRSPTDPAVRERFVELHSAYEAILALAAASTTTIEATIALELGPPVVSAINGTDSGIVVGASDGHVYTYGLDGALLASRALDSGAVKAVLDERGEPAIAWSSDQMFFFQDGAIVNAAPLPGFPTGLLQFGATVGWWHGNDLWLLDQQGAPIAELEFSKKLSDVVWVAERLVCAAGSLQCFQLLA